jgi:hypothetical protein
MSRAFDALSGPSPQEDAGALLVVLTAHRDELHRENALLREENVQLRLAMDLLAGDQEASTSDRITLLAALAIRLNLTSEAQMVRLADEVREWRHKRRS